ncbi:hypothetical protein [Listeria cornellensis]|uniref:Uncharacterized protein n=1 Tax=Listeria cornellensis FSL F6-0969 TaxID=1265820 RepID=W7BL40_9LIST|nr:hypothetical protein [Listeria cornellensis]EUJ26572.1 hypothetical protein PCORN_14619 [Listeria cornellensis FSL F6-0969]
MDRMHPEERIYFSLHILMRFGSPIENNTRQLSNFVTSEKIAEYAVTPIDYTIDILQKFPRTNDTFQR